MIIPSSIVLLLSATVSASTTSNPYSWYLQELESAFQTHASPSLWPTSGVPDPEVILPFIGEYKKASEPAQHASCQYTPTTLTTQTLNLTSTTMTVGTCTVPLQVPVNFSLPANFTWPPVTATTMTFTTPCANATASLTLPANFSFPSNFTWPPTGTSVSLPSGLTIPSGFTWPPAMCTSLSTATFSPTIALPSNVTLPTGFAWPPTQFSACTACTPLTTMTIPHALPSGVSVPCNVSLVTQPCTVNTTVTLAGGLPSGIKTPCFMSVVTSVSTSITTSSTSSTSSSSTMTSSSTTTSTTSCTSTSTTSCTSTSTSSTSSSTSSTSTSIASTSTTAVETAGCEPTTTITIPMSTPLPLKTTPCGVSLVYGFLGTKTVSRCSLLSLSKTSSSSSKTSCTPTTTVTIHQSLPPQITPPCGVSVTVEPICTPTTTVTLPHGLPTMFSMPCGVTVVTGTPSVSLKRISVVPVTTATTVSRQVVLPVVRTVGPDPIKILLDEVALLKELLKRERHEGGACPNSPVQAHQGRHLAPSQTQQGRAHSTAHVKRDVVHGKGSKNTNKQKDGNGVVYDGMTMAQLMAQAESLRSQLAAAKNQVAVMSKRPGNCPLARTITIGKRMLPNGMEDVGAEATATQIIAFANIRTKTVTDEVPYPVTLTATQINAYEVRRTKTVSTASTVTETETETSISHKEPETAVLTSLVSIVVPSLQYLTNEVTHTAILTENQFITQTVTGPIITVVSVSALLQTVTSMHVITASPVEVITSTTVFQVE